MKTRKELSIYVHIPFCVKKCNYCDFLSFSSTETMRASYIDALCDEIDFYANQETEVVTVYFGGGTPSLLSGTQVEVILNRIKSRFPLCADAEVTLEANPGTLTGEKLLEYRSAGINRLSIGLQSTHNKELRRLGRIHTYEQFLDNYQAARQAGFQNISVDLMAALPDQTLEEYLISLNRIAALNPEHISTYSLMIEEGTAFYEEKQLEEHLPTEDMEREMYYRTKEILGQHGYERYEISNYSKPGMESRHNIGYWTGRNYLGLGLGASSYYHGARFHNEQKLEQYMELWHGNASEDRKKNEGRNIETDIESMVKEYHVVTQQEAIEEYMFLGLRMTAGVSILEFEKRFGCRLYDRYVEQISKLEQQKLVARDGDYLKLTDVGIDVSNYVLSEFL